MNRCRDACVSGLQSVVVVTFNLSMCMCVIITSKECKYYFTNVVGEKVVLFIFTAEAFTKYILMYIVYPISST